MTVRSYSKLDLTWRLFFDAKIFGLVLLCATPICGQQKSTRTSSRPALPDGVVAHRDIVYAQVADKKLTLDIYVPRDQDDNPRPLVVWIHGGAWRAGNKRHCPAIPFVDQGFVAASISYRLSQEAIFPAQIHDCKAAIRWLRGNAKKYNIDPDRIGVWGSSAGGHLVALLGTSGDVRALEGTVGDVGHSSRVQAVCDFFGPTDLLKMDADSLPGSRIVHNAPDSPESQLIGGPIQEVPEKARLADPIKYVTPDDPPFLIVHGTKDPLVPWQQSQYLFDAFQKIKHTGVKLHLVEGAKHGFRGNPEVKQMVSKFFNETLQPTSN